jgi:hypothetical protein
MTCSPYKSIIYSYQNRSDRLINRRCAPAFVPNVAAQPQVAGQVPPCHAWNTLIESVPDSSTATKNRFASLAKTAGIAVLGDIDAVDMPAHPHRA